MRTFLAVPIVFLFLFVCLSAQDNARAHELKSYGSISVLLHINPDDDPIAGQPAELLFLTTDKEKKFKTEDCDCSASVIQNDQVLFSSPLRKADSSYRGIFAPAIPYTFPQKGIYTIKLAGKPKNNTGFQNFEISYDVRIDKDEITAVKQTPKNIFYYFVIMGTLAGVGYAIKLFFTKNTDKLSIDNLK